MEKKLDANKAQVKVIEHPIHMDQFGKTFLDIPYAAQSETQKLDIILPKSGEGPYPVIMVVHGGGWKYGFKRSHVLESVFKISSQGYAIVSIDYRLSREALWPAQVYDVKAAVRFIRKNGEKYNLRTDKIGCWGNSAGAHILAVAASTNGTHEIEDLSMGNEEVSADLDMAVFWYAPVDLYDAQEQTGRDDSELNQVMGYDVLSRPREESDIASATAHVNQHFPKTLLQAGTMDALAPLAQSEALYEKVKKVCGEERITLEVFEGARHGDPVFKANDNINHCLDFVDEYFEMDREKYPRTGLPEITWSDEVYPQ
ncbi:MAG: alpha/beta hydrolase [Hespellia sp.]|nr:alpha/beta hydrolase [Hespellia sp.]